MASAAEPRWLSESEHEAWMVVVGVIQNLPAALDSQLRRDAGLTHFDYGVMVSLSGAPRRSMTMTCLADRVRCSASRLSHGVARLEERGWVQRKQLAHDGRVTEATLTAAGLRKLAASAPGHVEEVRRLVIDALDARQLAALAKIGSVILGRIDEAAPPCAQTAAGRGMKAATKC